MTQIGRLHLASSKPRPGAGLAISYPITTGRRLMLCRCVGQVCDKRRTWGLARISAGLNAHMGAAPRRHAGGAPRAPLLWAAYGDSTNEKRAMRGAHSWNDDRSLSVTSAVAPCRPSESFCHPSSAPGGMTPTMSFFQSSPEGCGLIPPTKAFQPVLAGRSRKPPAAPSKCRAQP
jgi:hypothetical protein